MGKEEKMQKINYNLEMENIIKNLKKAGERKKLLLQACCGPCSSGCLERLDQTFNTTIFYYNPNIDKKEEYIKRTEEVEKLIDDIEEIENPIDLIVPEYNNREFYDAVKGYEKCPEGGDRCKICYRLRLEETAKFAKKEGYDYFTSTLSISPYKNAQWLNEIGMELEEKYNIKYLPSDFKKKNGYKRSIELSKKYDMYRQDYCGCIFSKIERDEYNKNKEK